MKIYISGPMTGMKDNNFPAFHKAATELRAAGYEVINPAEHALDNATWLDYMRNDIKLLMQCNAIAFLEGSDVSKGALIEIELAKALGFDVRFIDEWLCVRGEPR